VYKKEDIVLQVNDKIIGGVFDFEVRHSSENRYAYEILNSVPIAVTNSNSYYIITIKQYAKDFTGFDEGCNITFRLNNRKDIYKYCVTKSVKTYIDSLGKLVKKIEITADCKEEK
ncbi:MAG: hypothetical protein ACI4RM_01920, partial [Ruminococcus sp.]